MDAGPTDPGADGAGADGAGGPWAAQVVDLADAALRPIADPDRAAAMTAYMKHVAPFLGVPAPERRRALRGAWKALRAPTSTELGGAARVLMDRRERELHYAAYDLIDRHRDGADERFLADHVEALLTSRPWWDTVDGLGNAAVSPLCRRDGAVAAAVIDRWSASGDPWLIRAAIQHQRGWKQDTEVERVLGLCDRHWKAADVFVAKAIGWALRDLARLEPTAVWRFLDEHPVANPVAVREARRGLRAASGPARDRRPDHGHSGDGA